MIDFKNAFQVINNHLEQLQYSEEFVDLIDSPGRISAENIYTNSDFPRFNNSAMDGIAIQFFPNYYQWELIDVLPAGNYQDIEYKENCCIEIMTGAKLPQQFDTVIPFEDIYIKDGTYFIKDQIKLKIGQNIRLQGEDVKQDTLIIKKGDKINSSNINILASCGYNKINVLKKIKVGILVGGNELVDINQVPENDQIIASNLYTLFSLSKDSGFDYVSFGLVKDDKSEIKEKIEQALKSDIDILITSGGVSEGNFDFIQDVLKELNSEIIFWKVNIKPGKPILFAKNQKKLIFGLPGNPVAVFVGYKIFIDQYFNKQKYEYATLENDLKKKDGKLHFLRGIVSTDENGNKLVKLSGKQSSGDIFGLGNANCLILFDEELREMKKGDRIKCIMI